MGATGSGCGMRWGRGWRGNFLVDGQVSGLMGE